MPDATLILYYESKKGARKLLTSLEEPSNETLHEPVLLRHPALEADELDEHVLVIALEIPDAPAQIVALVLEPLDLGRQVRVRGRRRAPRAAADGVQRAAAALRGGGGVAGGGVRVGRAAGLWWRIGRGGRAGDGAAGSGGARARGCVFALGGDLALDVLERIAAVRVEVWVAECPALTGRRI